MTTISPALLCPSRQRYRQKDQADHITQRYAHINDDELDKGYYEIFEKK
jgi:hypothetical protein